MTDVSPPPVSALPRTWWSRYKWFVILPLGVMAGLAALAALVALILSFAFGIMRSTDAYQQGLSRAEANPAVASGLGTPITPGWLMSGNIDLNNDAGTADISIPVTGPRGSGTIHVVGTKTAGVWTYTVMDIALTGSHQVIDLSKPGQ